jgi:hypothetical protein
MRPPVAEGCGHAGVAPLALALLLLPASALAGVREKVAALAPPGVALVVDTKGDELVRVAPSDVVLESPLSHTLRAHHALRGRALVGSIRGSNSGQPRIPFLVQ